MASDDRGAQAAGDDELVSTIGALQRELDGLLESGKLRSVIEQAKGMIAERLGIGPEEAFEHLRAISQANNARLVDVAATIVGQKLLSEETVGFDESAFPKQAKPGGATSEAWHHVRDEPRTRAGASDAVATSLASAIATGDAAAQLLGQLVEVDVDACLVYAVRADNSLEMVGSWGYADDTASAWRRIPLAVEVPLTTSVRDNAALFFSTRDELTAAYPAMSRVPSTYASLMVLPVSEDGHPVGVVALSCESSLVLEPAAREKLTRQVNKIGAAILRGTRARDHDQAALGAVLRVTNSPWLVLELGSSSDVDGLVIEQVSDEVPGHDRLVGRRLLAAIPRLARDDRLVAELRHLMLHDGLLLHQRAELADVGAPWDGTVGLLRAVRAHGRLVLTWSDMP